jgi:hypothetical protein
MATTFNGIWYPDGTEPMNIKELLRDLAWSVDTAIQAVVVDSQWVTMSLSTGSGTARYRAVNIGPEDAPATLVCVQLNVAGLSPTSGSDLTIITAANGIPSAYRPGVAAWFGSRANVSGIVGLSYINTDGSIHVLDVTAGGLAHGTVTYFAG